MIDDARWERLLFHVLDELEADDIASERAAVHLYAVIYRRLEHPEAP